MKNLLPLISTALSLGLLFSTVIPTSAATIDQSLEQKTVYKDKSTLNKQKLDNIKKQIKLFKKTTINGDKYTEATANIDGVKAVIILDDGQELTDEMLTKASQQIDERKMAVDLREISAAVQPVPSTKTTTSAEASVESNLSITPQIVPPPETDGYLLGNSYRSFSALAAAAANVLFKGALGAIFTYAAIKVGSNTAGAVAIGFVAAAAGDFEPFSAHWTQARVWESWSSYYGAYLDDLSVTYYTSSSFSTVKTVFFKYDVKRYGSTF